MLRDRKELLNSNTPKAFLIFLCYVLVIIPIWLCVLLPIVILFFVLEKIVGVFKPKKKKDSQSSATFDQVAESFGDEAEANKSVTREFDLILFGATGFTGKQAAEYLAETYGTKLKWAIAGRRLAGLESLRSRLADINPALKDLPLIEADSMNYPAVVEMVTRTKVVATTAGPFALYSQGLVKACVEYGTHYCDITGETEFCREMIEKYDEKARKTGARIVHFCGHDSIPWDISTYECAKHLAERGDELCKIDFYDEIRAEPSGGTLSTANLYLFGDMRIPKSSLGFDPLLRRIDGDCSDSKISTNNQSYLGYSSQFKAWVGPFFMAMVNANCVRRSNAINRYSRKLKYSEAQVYASFFAGFITFAGSIMQGSLMLSAHTRALLQKFVFPKPGEGPTEEFMEKAFLQV